MRRDRLEVIAKILKFTAKGKRKTKILYYCNLSYTCGTKRISFLVQRGLLEKKLDYYYTTAKGMEFIEKFKEINNLLNKMATDKDTIAKHLTR